MTDHHFAKSVKEYDAASVDTAGTLLLRDMDDLPRALQDLHDAAARTARLYAWNKLLEYSVAHPKRTCELRMGMGDVALHVEGARGNLVFGATSLAYIGQRDLPEPEFLKVLWEFGEALGHRHADWFEQGVWVAHHGVMLQGEPPDQHEQAADRESELRPPRSRG